VVNNNKHVFWQALVVALIIFWSGILIGIFFEDSRVAELKSFYSDSETEIADFNLASSMIFDKGLSCDVLNKEARIFTDRIYKEAIKLEDYDNANKLTDRVISLHRKYDLLRTIIWKKIIDNKAACNETIDTLVYLYEYKNDQIGALSTQRTMANYITEVKKERGDDLILIPIATDMGILSLDLLLDDYGISGNTTILINEKYVINDLNGLADIRKDLDKD